MQLLTFVISLTFFVGKLTFYRKMLLFFLRLFIRKRYKKSIAKETVSVYNRKKKESVMFEKSERKIRNKKRNYRFLYAVIATIISFCSVTAYYALLFRPKGTKNGYSWSSTDKFSISNVVTVEKNPNEDFVIMNLADVQICDLELFPYVFKLKREIDELVERVKPNLITLTGDQVWSNEVKISINVLADILDGYGIPWAPVFGNHDLDGILNGNAFSDFYEGRKNCLYSRGPNNLGAIGNYAVCITENGTLIRTLYMLNRATNEYFTPKQQEWFNWLKDGVKDYFKTDAQAMCFFHRPIKQFEDAYENWYFGNATQIGEVNMFNGIWGNGKDYGFYNDLKSANVTDIVCGHFHSNSFTILYDGVRFTQALKTGETSYHHEDENVYMNGATVFKIDKNSTRVEPFYVSKDKYGVKGSDID